MKNTSGTSPLTRSDREAIAALCLMAAFADEQKHEAERARLQAIFGDLDASFSPALYQRVVLGEASPAEEAARLTTRPARLLAYEMAVGVCDADGRADAAEQAFLKELRAALGLDAQAAQRLDEAGDALATLPHVQADPVEASSGPAVSGGPPVGQDASPLDAMILKYAVLNGGLELLPQTLATMAIVPLQTKMVFRIGRHYGYELDQGHVKELLATVGLGMTSQVVETYARQLFGGFAQKALGKKVGKKKGKKLKKAAGVATGAAMSFAATYALGQVAKSYYAGGRQLGADGLRGLFDRGLEQGRSLYATHQGAVAESARTTDLSALLAAVRASP